MKLDQSLDEILSTTRSIRGGRGRGRNGRGARTANRPKVAAPAGGIQKPTKQVTVKGGKGVPTGPSNAAGRSPSTIRITGLVCTHYLTAGIHLLILLSSPWIFRNQPSRYVTNKAIKLLELLSISSIHIEHMIHQRGRERWSHPA